MKILLVQPGPLVYCSILMRLEPLGLERVAQALRMAGHEVQLVDLQIFSQAHYFRQLAAWKPDAVGFSLNYLANLPEVVDLAVETQQRRPSAFVFVGGHTASFVPHELLEYSQGAIDCVVIGEGEITAPRLLQEIPGGRPADLAGVVSTQGSGPPPGLVPEPELDVYLPARDLTRRRKRYFAGVLDPCASIEFSRGCPFHCSFCSAWTFYNRTYRKAAPEAVIEDLSRISEPNVFLMDDVAFIDPAHALAIAREVEKRNIRKRYSMETRCDVLIRNKEVFERWTGLGLKYLFLGFEAIDEEGLRAFRKRVSLNDNFRALEITRRLGIDVALNIIVSPDWDEKRFRIVEEWAAHVPEVVHLTVMTPYPGTETWPAEAQKITTRDYRLFDIQHAVTPTRLPLQRFYEELSRTQMVLYRKHLKKGNAYHLMLRTLKYLLSGRGNFAKAAFGFKKLHDPRRQYADHFRKIKYAVRIPAGTSPCTGDPAKLYVHAER